MDLWRWLKRYLRGMHSEVMANPVYIPRRSDVIRRKRLALRVARSKGRGRR